MNTLSFTDCKNVVGKVWLLTKHTFCDTGHLPHGDVEYGPTNAALKIKFDGAFVTLVAYKTPEVMKGSFSGQLKLLINTEEHNAFWLRSALHFERSIGSEGEEFNHTQASEMIFSIIEPFITRRIFD